MAPGRFSPQPGSCRNVARRSLVTKKSVIRASRAAGKISSSAGTNRSRNWAAGVSTTSSAADTETARYWPSASPEGPVRSKTHCTGESTAAANGSEVTCRS